MITKTCARCLVCKPLEDFGPRYDYPDKRLSWCKACETVRKRLSARQRLANPTTRAATTHRQKLWKYGLTAAAHAQLVADHAGRCAICNEEAELLIDHDHQTGRVRGLLCHQCNVGLGHFRDSAERLSRAQEYLCKSSQVTS